MKIINIEDVEVQLVGDQAFVYDGDNSEVLNITGIEFSDNCEEILINEIEQINNSTFGNTVALFN